MENVEALAKAQKFDVLIMQLKNKIENLEEGKSLKKIIDSYDKTDISLKDVTQKKLDIEKRIKRIEEDSKNIGDKIAQEEKKLYSGTITKPKELNAIQKEIESLRKKNDVLETRELELMQELDEVNKVFEKVSVDYKIISEDRGKRQDAYDKARSALEKQLEDAKECMCDVKSFIDPVLLSRYELIRKEKSGIGAAFLINGTCSGCHIALPENEIAEFIAKDEVGKCSNCKRLLIPPKYADV